LEVEYVRKIVAAQALQVLREGHNPERGLLQPGLQAPASDDDEEETKSTVHPHGDCDGHNAGNAVHERLR
jgi:hypothetical protein